MRRNLLRAPILRLYSCRGFFGQGAKRYIGSYTKWYEPLEYIYKVARACGVKRPSSNRLSDYVKVYKVKNEYFVILSVTHENINIQKWLFDLTGLFSLELDLDEEAQ